MKRAILFLTLCVAPSAMAAQAPVTQITGVTASREALRTQVNTRLAAAQSNFTEIYTALNGSPWLAQTTAPNIHNVFWIDTSGASPVIKYWDGDSWEIAASGVDGTYTLPTASTETKGGVKIGARLTMTGEVLSADVQTTDISGKQDTLVSGTNIKTVNGTSVLGAGNLVVGDGGGIAHATSDGAYYASRNGAWESLAGVFAAPLGADDNYVTDAEKVKLGNLSGTNTGDQDLSGYALTSSVLSKTNTTAFTPTADYHPVPKKYVDDSITASGGYTDEQAQDAAGAMFSGNTETGIIVTYDDATGKVNFVVPTTLASFTDDATHRLVTDTEKSTWNAKQNALVAGTDYLAPTGSAANLTGFPSSLATDTEVAAGYQPLDADLTDLADGSLTGSKVGTGVDGGNISTGTVADARIDAAIARDTEVTAAINALPNLAFGTGLTTTSSAGTDTISVTANTYQAYDADWLGITANGASLVSAANYAAMKTLLDTDDIQTLTGVSAGIAHLGTFTGSTILDSSTIKAGMQSLETAVEGKQNTIAANTYQAYDANMILWPSAISATEVGYLDGLGGALTTLLGAKAPLASPVFTTSVALPQGTAPTVDAAGEVAVDTTSDQFVYFGSGKRVLGYKKQVDFVIKGPVDADDFLLLKTQTAITVTDIHAISQGGTSISVDVQECDAAGANCATVDAAITADTDGAEDDGTLSNGAIDAGDWIKLVLGAPSGTVNFLSGSIYYVETAD